MSGGLAVSVAFCSNVVPPSQMIWFSLLLASWVLLTLAICSCLCSYYTGKLAHQTSLAEIHASAPVPKSEQPPLSFFGRICGVDEKWSCGTEILNNLALIFLIAAIILTVAFAAVNVNNLNRKVPHMSDASDRPSTPPSSGVSTPQPPINVQHSIVPPKFPQPAPSAPGRAKPDPKD